MRAPLLPSLLAVALLPYASLGAQSPKRAPAAEVRSARAAFAAGIEAVSRNPAAFLQELSRGEGCEVRLHVARRERGDSVQIEQVFDAGRVSARARMSMDPDGGIVRFEYASEGPAAGVRTAKTSKAGAVIADGWATAVTVLIAETSNQLDVKRLTDGWTAFVRACGGSVD